LFDPSVLMGMKRSVQIILDNGDILDVPYNESKGRNVTEIKDDNPSNKVSLTFYIWCPIRITEVTNAFIAPAPMKIDARS
jgi:hypothetical protein